jgi:hypothetical protein
VLVNKDHTNWKYNEARMDEGLPPMPDWNKETQVAQPGIVVHHFVSGGLAPHHEGLSNGELKEIQKKRFDALYSDAHIRKVRREALAREKKRVEAEQYERHREYCERRDKKHKKFNKPMFDRQWANDEAEYQQKLNSRLGSEGPRDSLLRLHRLQRTKLAFLIFFPHDEQTVR